MKYKIDLQIIADNLDFDIEDVKMLLEVFLESADDNLRKFKKAINTDNIETIFTSVHAIYGSASNLRLDKISTIAKEIEQNAKEKNDICYQESYEKLKSSIDDLKV